MYCALFNKAALSPENGSDHKGGAVFEQDFEVHARTYIKKATMWTFNPQSSRHHSEREKEKHEKDIWKTVFHCPCGLCVQQTGGRKPGGCYGFCRSGLRGNPAVRL
jgi:hypothetical protein